MVGIESPMPSAAWAAARLLFCGGATLIKVDADALVFQGFEKAGEQTVAQEWVVMSYRAGTTP